MQEVVPVFARAHGQGVTVDGKAAAHALECVFRFVRGQI